MAAYTSLFLTFLNKQTDADWSQTIERLRPAIHPVDQAAAEVWFSFFPLKLAQALQTTSNLPQTVRELKLAGKYRLADQVDTSAEFLYGHRYWSPVKRAVAEYAQAPGTPAGPPLAKHIQTAARRAAESLSADESLLTGITAAAFMTLQQVGYEAFVKASGPAAPASRGARSPERVLKERARTATAGWLSFLKLGEKEYTVTFRENDRAGRFRVIKRQEMASAAARDTRDYQSRDPRCIEGPIPVECRSAACGTCWVGVLAGAENLSEPAELEIRRMKEFGYPGFQPDTRSKIRLACQAKCFGNVTIAIPPWNGVIGRLNYE